MNGFIATILQAFGINNSRGEKEETPEQQAKREHAAWRNGQVMRVDPLFGKRSESVPPVPARDAITEITSIDKTVRSLPPPMRGAPVPALKPGKTPRIHNIHDGVMLFEKGAFGEAGGPRNRERDSEAVERMAGALRLAGLSTDDVTRAVRLAVNVLRKRELECAARSLAMHRAGTVREETLTGDEILEILGVWQMLPVAIGTTKQELVTLFT